MKTTAARLTFSRLPTTFEGLVKFHPPRPIHDRPGYDNTAEIMDVLAVAGPKLNADQADYLVVVARTTPYDPQHRHAGIRRFYVDTTSGNARAAAFYEKAGFTRVGSVAGNVVFRRDIP